MIKCFPQHTYHDDRAMEFRSYNGGWRTDFVVGGRSIISANNSSLQGLTKGIRYALGKLMFLTMRLQIVINYLFIVCI